MLIVQPHLKLTFSCEDSRHDVCCNFFDLRLNLKKPIRIESALTSPFGREFTEHNIPVQVVGRKLQLDLCIQVDVESWFLPCPREGLSPDLEPLQEPGPDPLQAHYPLPFSFRTFLLGTVQLDFNYNLEEHS